MTTYTALTDAEIDTDSPITESMMTRLRDNPIAMFEGATGAPVLATGYVTNAMLASGSVGSSKMIAPAAAGTATISRARGGSDLLTTNSSGYPAAGIYSDTTSQTLRVGKALVSGVVRVTFQLKISTVPYTAYARVMKNGALVAESTTTSASYTTKTTDVTVAVGDIITIQIRTSNAVGSADLSSASVTSDTANMAIT